MSKTKNLISIIVTAHREGASVFKTVRNLEASLSRLGDLSAQIIVHCDVADQVTLFYADACAKQFGDVVVLKNNFSDVGKSKNFAIKQTQSEYILCVHAGDLVSVKFLEKALRKLEKQSDKLIAYHPETILFFDSSDDQYRLQYCTSSSKINLGEAFSVNPWSSIVFAKRGLFERCPFQEDGLYDSVAETFNIKSLEIGCEHDIISGTVHFCRRDRAIYPVGMFEVAELKAPSALFDAPQGDHSESQEQISLPKALARRLDKFYVDARNVKAINNMVEPVAEAAKKLLGKEGRNAVPDTVLREWEAINQFNNRLFPTKNLLARTRRLDAHPQLLGIYLGQKKFDKSDYIFVVPWIIAGGADKVLLNYVKALQELKPGIKITVISTLAVKNPWASKLSDDVEYIDFGNAAKEFGPRQKDILFSRIITQREAKAYHIINSAYGYEWASHHISFFKKSGTTLNVSLFCHDIVHNSRTIGKFDYADSWLADIYPFVDNIFTDNQAVINYSCVNNGFDEKKFIVHYQPDYEKTGAEIDLWQISHLVG